MIFEMYAKGESYNKIINQLQGYKGKRGKPLGKNSLYSILTNERYIGIYTWNKKKYKYFRKWAGGKLNPECVRIEGVIPPIIDRDLWEKVKTRMENNKKRAANKAKHEYLLSGLIECAECGAVYVGHASTNKKGYTTRYYCCGNKYRTRTCKSKNINADEIEVFVNMHLKAYLLSMDFKEIARNIADQVNKASADLEKEKKELANITLKINNGVKVILGGMYFPELEEEIERLRVRKNELLDIITRKELNKRKVDPAKIVELFQYAIDNWEVDKKNIVKHHISKIYANIDGSFSVNIGVHINGCGGRI